VTEPQRGPGLPEPAVAFGDTNLFVALLAGPRHALHASALGLFRRVADGRLAVIVTPIVVAELVYVSTTVFGWTRPVAAERIETLLDADGLLVREASTLARALRLFAQKPRLDFADAYLAAAAIEVGPAVVASLDRDLDRIAGVRRISA
jgi:predicted nucleic acid-binding protein